MGSNTLINLAFLNFIFHNNYRHESGGFFLLLKNIFVLLILFIFAE